MLLPDLLPFMKKSFEGKDSSSISEMGVFQRRLFEIAFWDNHVTEGHRVAAAEVAETITKDIERASAGDPKLLEACKACVEFMVGHAPFGRLHWLLTEHNVPTEQICAFAVRPEHAPLLRGFFEDAASSGPQVIKDFIRDMLKELIKTRRPQGTRNAVLILHALAVGRDATLEAILEPEEINAFRNAHKDYAKARGTLVDLGIQPDVQGDLSFAPVPTIDDLAGLLVLNMQAVRRGDEEEDALKPYLDTLDDEGQSNYRFARMIMAIYLSIQQAGDIYGADFRNAFQAASIGKFPSVPSGDLEFLIKKIEVTELETFDRGCFSPDFLFLDEVVHIGKEEGRIEESFEAEKESLTKGSALLSAYRAHFIEYFRYRLRYFSALERGEPGDRDPLDYADDWVFQAADNA